MKEHEYGFDYDEDVRALYGRNYSEINNKRLELFNNFTPNVPEVKVLRNIIQNPIPITKERFYEWKDIKDKLMEKCNYYLSEHDKDILNRICNFAYVYHVKK